jgi:hypothetical protein
MFLTTSSSQGIRIVRKGQEWDCTIANEFVRPLAAEFMRSVSRVQPRFISIFRQNKEIDLHEPPFIRFNS